MTKALYAGPNISKSFNHCSFLPQFSTSLYQNIKLCLYLLLEYDYHEAGGHDFCWSLYSQIASDHPEVCNKCLLNEQIKYLLNLSSAT